MPAESIKRTSAKSSTSQRLPRLSALKISAPKRGALARSSSAGGLMTSGSAALDEFNTFESLGA
jgi:hypothetical protein